MNSENNKIIYTKTDEAPLLATYSLLPIIRAFVGTAGITVETRDISLAGRIIAAFPEYLDENQRLNDDLAELGKLAQTPQANIIKLPNISASLPQLQAAIKELQAQGYNLPNYPANPTNDKEQDIQARYLAISGSAVNPVLREGNSDRRVAPPVKEYAKKNPHSMGAWSQNSKSQVMSMDDGDFYATEQSLVIDKAQKVNIRLTDHAGQVQPLKQGLSLLSGEVIDAAVMNVKALRAFYSQAIDKAQKDDSLLSLHLKATMMKVSDPILFGHAVSVFYAEIFSKYEKELKELKVNPNNGIAALYRKLANLDKERRRAIKVDIQKLYEKRPRLAMVNSDKGITNLHMPNDVIVDASMPAAIRASGQMWGADGQLHDTLAMIPDRSYAGVYQATIEFCKAHGAFDVTTMGNVANVGLMAKKAEEYGSHDKTFEIPAAGVVEVIAEDGTVLMQHQVEQGDIWRMCQTKDEAIKDWVRLAVERAKATGKLTIFWLDEKRAHDRNLIELVNKYLSEFSTEDLDLEILNPVLATQKTLEKIQKGEDVISVTGNVLRDYLTDLFPILELGTSAKMLSIVPLLSGGGLYETGAGGSAPKHAQQLAEEGHLRWDSLGEFLALTVSLEDLGKKTQNHKTQVLAKALNEATGRFLELNRSPLRHVGELDNRGSHYYLALYWAEALSRQDEDEQLQATFIQVAKQLNAGRSDIVAEFKASQGEEVDLGGYYHPQAEKVELIMRASPTLNQVIDSL